MEETTYVGFAGWVAGAILFGYLLALPLWGAGVLWNRRMGEAWQFNPWWPPLIALLFIYACAFINAFTALPPMEKIACIGLIPATVTCLVSAIRFENGPRRPSSDM